MRTIAEIRKDLNAKVAEVKGIDASNAEATQKGLSELDALVKELEAAKKAAEETAARQLALDKATSIARAALLQ